MLPAWLAAAAASKWFLPALITGGGLGMTAMTERGRSKERKATKKQLEIQKLLQEASIEATKKEVEESRINTEKYKQEILKFKKAEDKKAQEDMMMQAFLQRQGQNTAVIMQALQGMSARPSGTPTSGGMMDIMRQGF